MNILSSPSAQHAANDIYPTRTSAPESWIDRADPVLWQDWNPQAPVTRAQAEAFERDGFLVLHDLFSPRELRAVTEAAGRLRSNALSLRGEDVVTEPGAQEVRTVFRLEDHDTLLARLAADRRLAGVAQFLLGDRVYVHQSRLNYKPGFTGKEFYWHSDFETWHAEDGMPRMRAVSASLLLTDNTAQNGALMLMPGSHRVFVSCHGETPQANHRQSLKAQKVGTPSQGSLAALAERHGIRDAEGPAGTLILFDCNTMHGSNGNITPFPRSNVFFVYNAVSNALAAPFAAPAPRPSFLARRGQPEPLEIASGAIV